MKIITFVLIVFCVLSSVAQGQSLQEMIEQSEEKKAERTETMKARQVGQAQGARIHYQVSPRAMEAAIDQSIVSIGYEDLTGNFQRTGFGFFVASNGFILSVSQAMGFPDTTMVRLDDGETLPAEVVDQDLLTGVVLLKTTTDRAYLPLAAPEDMQSMAQLYFVLPEEQENNAETPVSYSVIPCSAILGEFPGATGVKTERYWLDIRNGDSLYGAPILNVYGEVSGICWGEATAKGDSDEKVEVKAPIAVSISSGKRLLQLNTGN